MNGECVFSKSSLEMLITVAKLESFTAAAEMLHKVPSSISYSVKQAEQELDVVLFRRLARKVELTPAGQVFIDQAVVMLKQMETLKAQTKRASFGWQSNLKITLDNVVKLEELKPLVETFYREFEHAELQINMEVFNGSWEAIAQGRADIVIGATSSVPVNGDFEVKEMGLLGWSFVVSPQHPCADKLNLTESDLRDYPFICLDDTSTILPKRYFGGYPGQRRLLLPNWFSAIEAIKKGVGVGYLPRHIAAPLINDAVIIEKNIPDPQPDSPCCLVWKKDSSHKLIQWMLDYLGTSEQLNHRWLS